MQTYVYEGAEVVQTGRTAVKELKNPKGVVVRTMTLVEIHPLGEPDGWKKWVDPAQLFVVK